MNPQQYDHVQQLFLRLQNVRVETRSRELAKEEDEIRREVESLLVAHESCGTFLEHSAQGAPFTSLQRTAKVQPLQDDTGSTRQVGPYRLLQQIGEGGHGTVFMAEQKKPIARKVAVKLIKPGMDSKQVLARFYAERQALALMDHPSIARVFDAGTTETGSPYFVMELVRGIPIHEFCEQNDLSLRERLRLFLQVCDAVHHAHRKGVIHRDLKPSNVLVTMGDAEPIAKVIDFGIAKALDSRLTEQTLFTEYGQMIGTLEYMSPEQAEMSAVDIDTRSDVYSLGVLLYQLLTGKTPISKDQLLSKGLLEISRQMRDTDPATPSSRITQQHRQLSRSDQDDQSRGLTNLPSGDLDWITMKALAKDRRRRYDSALDFSRDISRFLQGDPVHAHPPSIFYSFTKFASRHGVAVAVGLLVLASCLVGIIGLSTGLRRASTALNQAQIDRDAAREAQETADQNARKLAANMHSEVVQAAWRASETQDAERAMQLLDSCLPEMRGWEWEFVAGRQQGNPHGILRQAGNSAITSIALSSVSKQYAEQTTKLAACVLENGKVEVRDLSRDQLLQTLEGEFRANAACLVANASKLVIGTSGSELLLFIKQDQDWVLAESKALALGGIYDVAISSDATTLAACTGGGFVVAFDLTTMRLLDQWELPSRAASVVVLAGTNQIVATGLDGNAYMLRIGDDAIQDSFVSESSLHQVVQRNDRKLVMLSAGIAVGVDVGSLSDPPKQLVRCKGLASALAITPLGSIAVGSGDGSIVVLDATNQQRNIEKFDMAVTALVADGEQLIAALSDGRLLHVKLDGAQGWLPTGETPATAGVLLPSRGIMVSLDDNGWMRSFDTKTGKLLSKHRAHQDAVWAVACDRSETLLATVGEDQRLCCWELPGLKLRFERQIDWGVRDVCVATDGAWIAAAPPAREKLGGQEGTIGIWDAETGEIRRQLAGHDNWVLKMSATPEGNRLVSSCENRASRLWNVDTGKSCVTLTPQGKSPVVQHAFDQTSKIVFLAHRDGWITSWNLDDGTPISSWSAFGDAITGLAITKDGRILATSRSSEFLRVRDIRLARNVAEFDLGLGYLRKFSLSSDGKLMAVAAEDRRVLLSPVGYEESSDISLE